MLQIVILSETKNPYHIGVIQILRYTIPCQE